jgi:serine/threonine protein kinase
MVILHDFAFELSSYRGLVVFMPLFCRDLGKAIDSADLGNSGRLSVARDLFTALDYLHSSSPSIVHRDVKPENLLLDNENRAFLTDLSFMRFSEEGGGCCAGEESRAGSKKKKRGKKPGGRDESSEEGSGVLGTPTYIAPEVFKGSVKPLPSLDCWAAGVLLLELFQNHRLPVDRDKAALRMIRVARETMKDSPVPSLLKRLLEEDPLLRMSSKEALSSSALAETRGSKKEKTENQNPPPEQICFYASSSSSPSVLQAEALDACRKLLSSAPHTPAAALEYKKRLRSKDMRLLCMVACKVYEHFPLSDQEMLDCFRGRFSMEDLLETQEQLLSVTGGILLVPYHKRLAGPHQETS